MMNDNELKPLNRETIEEWIETLDNHGMPDWIQQHMALYREDPEKGHLWDARDYGGFRDTPCLLLTTVGRKSGKPFTLPLLYGRDGDRCVIVGSKGGAPEHPAWYLNLAANPRVQVQVASDRFVATARTITGPQRDRLWIMMTGVYPPLASYQQCTDRLIPVVVLERA